MFKKCLAIGKIYENKSINILLKYGFTNIILDNSYNSYYDLEAVRKNKKVYIEVKYNSLTDKTHKIFLECCKHKNGVLLPSGISITKATYYIFYSNTKYYIINTNKVKKILENTIKKEFIKVGHKKPTHDELINYIEHKGLRTKNSIGILISVDDVIRKCKYKGIHINSRFNKKMF